MTGFRGRLRLDLLNARRRRSPRSKVWQRWNSVRRAAYLQRWALRGWRPGCCDVTYHSATAFASVIAQADGSMTCGGWFLAIRTSSKKSNNRESVAVARQRAPAAVIDDYVFQDAAASAAACYMTTVVMLIDWGMTGSSDDGIVGWLDWRNEWLDSFCRDASIRAKGQQWLAAWLHIKDGFGLNYRVKQLRMNARGHK